MEQGRKCILFIAASLDGFIAKKDHSLDWLFKAEHKGDGDNGYHQFYEDIDTILMGRKTFDQIMVLENGSFPYKNKECFVFTKSPEKKNPYVEFVSEDAVSFIKECKRKKAKNIWLVGGGDLLKVFLEEKLLDELIITIVPSIIGNGIRIFYESESEMGLSLKEIKQYNQFAQLHYVICK